MLTRTDGVDCESEIVAVGLVSVVTVTTWVVCAAVGIGVSTLVVTVAISVPDRAL